MLEKFICPDKEQISVKDCLENCRMGERCLTLPTLTLISREREWNGVASTTQLLNGTMMEFLKLTRPYSVDPDGRAFMLAGTIHHSKLENIAKELNLPAEIPLNIDRDIFDLIEFSKEGLVLTDYKMWGSYKVAKALGLTKVGTKPDPSGAVYQTNSKWGRKGEPKMVPVYVAVPENADNREVEYQLNRYRVMLKQLEVKIHRMQLQVTVRDGGIAVAKSRGLDRNVYRIPVRLLADEDVVDYFDYKAACLEEALSTGNWLEPCTPSERWDNTRCSRYCDVSQFCGHGKLLASLNMEEEVEL